MTNRAFDTIYGSETACLDTLFRLRYGHLVNCPFCGKPADFQRLEGAKNYRCGYCSRTLNPAAGTIFGRTKIDLSKWFQAIYLITHAERPVSARELQVQIGLSYKSACHITAQIRELMAGGAQPGGENPGAWQAGENPGAMFIEIPDGTAVKRVMDPVAFCRLLMA